MSFQKKKRIKSEKYLTWVRSLPCANCQKPGPSVPHHIKGVGNFSGAGMKASDYLTCPLCNSCHSQFHAGVVFLFSHEEQYRLIVETLDRAFQEGVIKI